MEEVVEGIGLMMLDDGVGLREGLEMIEDGE
jgi:hypothetical protein